MKIHFIERRAAFAPSEGLGFLDDYMFHGVVSHSSPLNDNNLGDMLKEKLALIRNGYMQPDVTKPFRNLVVTETIVNLISGTRNIDFHEVNIEKLFYSEYKYGTKWAGAPTDFDGLEAYYRNRPGAAPGACKLPKYFELVTENLEKIKNSFRPLLDYRMDGTMFEEKITLSLNDKIFCEYPILWTSNGVAIEDAVYKKLDSHIDKRFFNHAVLSI